MKHIIKNGIVPVIILISMFMTTPLLAQNWSNKQKKVWKNVETYHELKAKGDIDGFLEYFHEDYSGFHYNDFFPGDKDLVIKYVKNYFPKSKIIFYKLKPVAIKIHGNIAIVHYYYSGVTKYDNGTEKIVQERWTDILKKQNDKWVMIGDHGGPVKIR